MDDFHPDFLPMPSLSDEFLRDQWRRDQFNRKLGRRCIWCSLALYLGTLAVSVGSIVAIDQMAGNGLGALILFACILLLAASGIVVSLGLGVASLFFFRGGIGFLLLQTVVILIEAMTALFLLFTPMFSVG